MKVDFTMDERESARHASKTAAQEKRLRSSDSNTGTEEVLKVKESMHSLEQMVSFREKT